MNQEQMIADLIAKLDQGITNGVGHINVDINQEQKESVVQETMGCADCSNKMFPGMAPTLLMEEE